MPPVLKPVLNPGLQRWDCHAHKRQKRTLPKTEGKRGGLKDWDCHVASLLAKTEGKRKLATSEGRRRGLPRSQNTKAFARKDGREKRELFASPRNVPCCVNTF